MVQEEVEYLLTVNVDEASTEIRKLQSSVMSLLSQVRRLTGNEQLDKAISKAQQTITALERAIVVIKLFEAASGPVGWATAIISLISTGIAASDLIDYDSRGF